jgi:UDP-N-acetylglucosamine acyltransferase
MVHPTAVVHPRAEIDPSTVVGPYAVIEELVVIGPGCRIGPHVHITGRTVIGANNRFYTGCVLGEEPQDLKYKNEPTGLRIGNNNVVREHVTVHRSAVVSEETVIGSGNFLMAHCHVGHNSVVGDNVLLANGALLAGHVCVEDRAFISGHCMVHQFTRIGTLAMMQGRAGISKDLPPFTVARGINGICGLNIIGLRRAGLTSDERLELKKLYHFLFRSGRKLREAEPEARIQFLSSPARILLDFIHESKRGICPDVSRLRESDAEDLS